MLNKEYARGYKAGYKAGVVSGLQGSSARCVMEHDLEFIYGTMCLVMKRKYGKDDDEIQRFVEEIQESWDEIGAEAENSTERMAELVLRETGVPLMQMTDEILNAGKDELLNGC